MKKSNYFYAIFFSVCTVNKRLLVRFFQCAFLLYAFNLHSLSFSKDIYKSLEKKVPDWVNEQIDSDLKNCQLDRKIEDEYNHLQSNSPNEDLVFFSILNNKITIKGLIGKLKSHRKKNQIKYILNFFRKASHRVEFPDINFIVYIRNQIEMYLDEYSLDGEPLNIPIFVRSKKKETSTGILIPSLRFFYAQQKYFKLLDEKSQEMKWESKINKFFWRGISSGFSDEYADGSSPRLRLVKESLSNPDILDAAFTSRKCLLEKCPTLNCNDLKFSERIQEADQIKYKYLIAVQGDSYPSSLHWQLYSNSLLLFVDTPYIEWYYSGIKPYVDYIPLKNDYSDLREKMIWLQENDALCEQIAKNGAEFSREQLSNERVIHYTYLLLCKYKEKFQDLVDSAL